MGFSFTPDIDQTIVAAANRYGIDPNSMRAIAQIESAGNPNAQNPRSSAGGLFQFIDSTANQYGLENRFDAGQAADAGARLARDNAARLRSVLGREPTAGELYLAHQQGAGGASRLLRDPNARAIDIAGGDAIRLNGGNNDMTAQEFAALWTNKADRLVGGAGASTAAPATGGAPTGTSFVPQETFEAALARVGAGLQGQAAPSTPQDQGEEEKPLSFSQKLGGVGAALMQLESGGGQAQNLGSIIDQARQMPAFNFRKGLNL